MKHRFHPAAEAEHLEQIAYFEEQQAGLGRRYLTEVESAIARACAAPRQHRVEQAPDQQPIQRTVGERTVRGPAHIPYFRMAINPYQW